MKNLLLVAVLLSQTIVHADVAGIQKKQEACLKGAMSNYAMGVCMNQTLKESDKELNSVYKKLVDTLKAAIEEEKNQPLPEGQGSGEILKSLVQAEKSWIKFRDDNCDYISTDFLGGSGQGLALSSCIVDMTLKRVTELNERLQPK